MLPIVLCQCGRLVDKFSTSHPALVRVVAWHFNNVDEINSLA